MSKGDAKHEMPWLLEFSILHESFLLIDRRKIAEGMQKVQ